ncbi:LysR family transcriptional regulator [Inquilinus sp. NPDC058860]|uniref:LysR family transcriptional regulator n=1 Tax=Inquilinus sp. NPDC058860 TaxID=3346652 RepID=UPI0036B080D1
MGSTFNVQLRAFHAVATEGSFTKAARSIGVSQSTLRSRSRRWSNVTACSCSAAPAERSS